MLNNLLDMFKVEHYSHAVTTSLKMKKTLFVRWNALTLLVFFQASRHCLGNILDRYLIESLYRM